MKSGVRQLTACTLFLYGLVFLAIVFVAIVGLWLFGPTRLRDKDLTEIPFASWFPESAMYIEGYCVVTSSIESRISFYKVTIDRSEVEEFMQHAPGTWVEGNAIIEGFPSRQAAGLTQAKLEETHVELRGLMSEVPEISDGLSAIERALGNAVAWLSKPG